MTNGANQFVQLNLADILADTADALNQAAKEAEEEEDGFPRNLSAALNRVSMHVEFFLRVTNPKLNTLSADDEVRSEITELRTEAARGFSSIGIALQCPNGIIEYDAMSADDSQCKRWLVGAADDIKLLAGQFEATLNRLILIRS